MLRDHLRKEVLHENPERCYFCKKAIIIPYKLLGGKVDMYK